MVNAQCQEAAQDKAAAAAAAALSAGHTHTRAPHAHTHHTHTHTPYACIQRDAPCHNLHPSVNGVNMPCMPNHSRRWCSSSSGSCSTDSSDGISRPAAAPPPTQQTPTATTHSTTCHASFRGAEQPPRPPGKGLHQKDSSTAQLTPSNKLLTHTLNLLVSAACTDQQRGCLQTTLPQGSPAPSLLSSSPRPCQLAQYRLTD